MRKALMGTEGARMGCQISETILRLPALVNGWHIWITNKR